MKGDTGDIGPAGAQGIQGVKGDTGNAGAQGIQGVQGDTGLQGIQGVKGDTGLQGIQGIQGTQGIQGVQGNTGPAGDASTIVRLAVDNAAISSTALVAVANLTFNALAAGVYDVEWMIWVTIATATETFGVNVVGQGAGGNAASGNYVVDSPLGALVPATVNGAGPQKSAGAAVGTAVTNTAFGNNGQTAYRHPVRVRAIITTPTAGAVNLQLNGSTTGAIVVKAGSQMKFLKIA